MTPYLFNLSHDPREFKPISRPLDGRESCVSNFRYDAYCVAFECGSDLIFHHGTQRTAQIKQSLSPSIQLAVEKMGKNLFLCVYKSVQLGLSRSVLCV